MTTKIGEIILKHYNENIIKILEENGCILTRVESDFIEDRYIISVPCEEK